MIYIIVCHRVLSLIISIFFSFFSKFLSNPKVLLTRLPRGQRRLCWCPDSRQQPLPTSFPKLSTPRHTRTNHWRGRGGTRAPRPLHRISLEKDPTWSRVPLFSLVVQTTPHLQHFFFFTSIISRTTSSSRRLIKTRSRNCFVRKCNFSEPLDSRGHFLSWSRRKHRR